MFKLLHTLFFVTLLALSGCVIEKKLNPESFVGKYQTNVEDPNKATLEIRPDQTFIYTPPGFDGNTILTSTGRWRLSQGDLFLHSFKQLDDEPAFGLIELPKDSEGDFKIKIFDINQEPISSASCLLRQDGIVIIDTTSNEEGYCQFENAPGNILEIQYPDYTKALIEVARLQSHNLMIELKKEEGYYEYFTNRRMLVKGDKIFDLKKPEQEREEVYFQKIIYKK